MSNNAAVCADGSEIGRAQALRAAACGIPPIPGMNPVLIKPEVVTREEDEKLSCAYSRVGRITQPVGMVTGWQVSRRGH
jgi:hypothetical protein